MELQGEAATGVRAGRLGARGLILRGGAEAGAGRPMAPAGRSHWNSLAFAGLLLFVFLLYARPSEAFPELLGSVPVAKTVALVTLFFYLISRLAEGKAWTSWPRELICVLTIALLGLALLPVSFSSQASYPILFDTYPKTICVFVMLINLLDSRVRMNRMLWLVVLCGTVHAMFAIRQNFIGEFALKGERIAGFVQGVFEDPNDLAANFDLLLPISVALAFTCSGVRRAVLVFCALVLIGGTVSTMSRGGFLGLLVTSVFLLWKLGRNHWRGAVVTAALAGAMLFVLAPGSYRNRLSTLFVSNPEMDSSIEQRMDLLNRGWYLATHHLAIGIGMGNFREYSAENKAAHNSYLEISAELGVAGLLAYLILIVSPFLRLRQMEKSADEFDVHVSAGLQASLIAYAVCGLFLSLEYSWLVYLIVPPAIVLARLERSSIEAFPGAEAVSARQGAIWQSARALGGGVIFNPRGYLWQQR